MYQATRPLGTAALKKASPAFLFGLLIRLVLIVGVIPWTQEFWFIPFLTHIPESETLDIWTEFVASGGSGDAFPYGLVYIVVYAPATIWGQMLAGAYGAKLGLGLTILALDVLMLGTLRKLAPTRLHDRLTWLYWLSPITLYIGYWHGHLDILPTLLLTLSLLCLKQARLDLSAIWLALAVASKISMAMAAPLVFIYLIGTPRFSKSTPRYVLIALGTFALAFGSLLGTSGFLDMSLGTPELKKGIALSVNYANELRLYILPMVYAGLMLVVWRIRRISSDELVCLTGLGFLALYMLTPAAPGWAMWFAAFLALHTARSNLRAGFLYVVLNFAFVGLHLILSSGARSALGPTWNLTQISVPDHFVPIGRLEDWIFSLLAVSAVALAAQMFRERILLNNFHQWTRKPVVVGIAGDSGAGKDTLSDLIRSLFGPEATSTISGDDYHAWDRHKPMWRALTHLHPNANDLDRFAADVMKLAAGRAVSAPHYDHQIGRMTKPIKIGPNNLVIVSGLHALFRPDLNERYDLKIYLDMHEGLRRHLKVRRDVSVRGHPIEKVLRSIESRYPDSREYIAPQKRHADLVVSLEPVRASEVEDFNRAPEEIELRIRVRTIHLDSLRLLERLLVSACGLSVVQIAGSEGSGELVVEGWPTALQVKLAGQKLAPLMEPHLALRPVWHSGQLGLLQLIALSQFDRLRASAGGSE